MHAPFKHSDDYLWTTRPSSSTTSSSSSSLEFVDLVLGKQSGRSGRRNKKRKYASFDVPQLTKKPCPPPLEQDEYFLHYLTVRHGGNVDTAQLALLVASGAGRGKQERGTLRVSTKCC